MTITSLDPLAETVDLLPTAHPADDTRHLPSGPGTRPFGMTLARVADPAVVDLSGVAYDPDRQIAVIDGAPAATSDTLRAAKQTPYTTTVDHQKFPDTQSDRPAPQN